MQYFREAKDIWHTYVPEAGQADTVQGELLRAVEKLRDEAIRNGNINWDDDFETLLAYLEEHLLDPTVYPPSTLDATRAALNRLKDHGDPCLEDAIYDQLGDRVVECFKYFGSRPHTKNPHLQR